MTTNVASLTLHMQDMADLQTNSINHMPTLRHNPGLMKVGYRGVP